MVAISHLGFAQTFFEILQFFHFLGWQPSAILDFKKWKFNCLIRPEGGNASLCQNRLFRCGVIAIFRFFKSGCPQSWNCLGHIWTAASNEHAV